MKKTILLSVIAIIAASIVGVAASRVSPSKNKTTRNLTMQAFDEIETHSAIDVVFQQASTNTYSVAITAPENIQQYIKVNQRRDKITITVDRNVSFNGNCDIKAVVKSPTLSDIELNGASSFKCSGLNMVGHNVDIEANGASSIEISSLKAVGLEIEANGASTVKISKITATSVEAEASGASTVNLDGKTDEADLDANGASTISASKLKATFGKLEASGASSIESSIKNVRSTRSSGASSIDNK